MTATLTETPIAPTTGSTSAPSTMSKIILGVFVTVPLAGLLIGVPVALASGWVTWLDIAMLVGMYYIGIHGITVGYHRLFTHGAFKAGPVTRAALALMGSVAIEGRVVDWVADHRKHHQNSDQDPDPHSPWKYGTSAWAITKGMLHAHVGWIFTYTGTDPNKYAPDLLADKTIDRISRWWPLVAIISLGLPGAIGYAVYGPEGALRAAFWASLVRVALVHHMTWTINSVCHVWGTRPFKTRDQSRNVAVLAPLTGGESWHNYHHADPSSARHGVLPGQLDTSAIIISALEKTGLAWDVKWPSNDRIASKKDTTTST